MGQYRMPYVRTPYFMVASQYDSFQLSYNVGHKPATLLEKQYAQNFSVQTRQLISSLLAGQPRMASAFYSWACYNHAITCEHEGFSGATCTDRRTTLEQAFIHFMLRMPLKRHAPILWEDTCDGFACGSGCRLAWRRRLLSLWSSHRSTGVIRSAAAPQYLLV